LLDADVPAGAGGVYARAVRRRAPDAERVRGAVEGDPVAFGAGLGLTAEEAEAFSGVVARWLTWYAPRTGRGGGESWVPDRYEHRFELRAVLPEGERALEAPEYLGGRLDWHAFVARRVEGAPREARPSAHEAALLPVPIEFTGMAAVRFWEMEDARVDLGAIAAGPADTARLLLAEFALVWAHDWFQLPVVVPGGVLSRIDSVQVTDTFGVVTEVRPHEAVRPDPGWRLWRLDTPGQAAGLTGYLLVPPALSSSLESEPIEEIHLFRDEGANMVWAVERVLPDGLGRPLDTGRAEPAEPAPEPGPTLHLRYVPLTTPPPSWIPLAPAGAADGARLVRAALVDERVILPPPRGALLEDIRLRDDEVPREGARLTRRWQAARARDGSLHLWLTRAKLAGRLETASALRFDHLEPR
ncbi:MAG: hypothetical protein L0027_17240, partial [Candidatus Rokubacteria bacterium]|nr:hypothetical protein [Candidatus Rokubacteria bacterium]